ncbi:MAG: hypothetical protein LUE11_00615 [Clostridia bacterium]|nr:hypothetical protein [Clostridia bacterium]
MFCVIQQIQLKKPNRNGAYKELEAYPMSFAIRGVPQPISWHYQYTGGQFERPHKEAYRISIHRSYREGRKVKKQQFSVATVSWYELAEDCLYDCISDSRLANAAEKLSTDTETLYDLIYDKIKPLQERIMIEFQQSEEGREVQRQNNIIKAHILNRDAFCSRLGVDGTEYDRCYDVFGELRNPEYLRQLEHQQNNSRYDDSFQSNYSYEDFSSYTDHQCSTYTNEQRGMLREFYKVLSKKFHPDLNRDRDTTKEMQLLNSLKSEWGL